MGHRLSRNAIIGIVVGAVLVVAGAAVVFVLINKGSSTPKPVSTIPTGAPSTSAPSGQPTLSPTSTPRPTSRPSGQPSSAPVPSGGGTTVQTSYGTIFVPSGFSDQGSSTSGSCTTNTLSSNRNGLLIYGACDLPGGVTLGDFDQALLKADQQALDPSAALCEPIKTSRVSLTGTSGSIPADAVSICLDVTPQSGPVFHAQDLYIAGLAHKPDGSTVGVTLNVFAPADEFKSFAGGIPDAAFLQTVFAVSP